MASNQQGGADPITAIANVIAGGLDIIGNSQKRKIAYQQWLNSNPVFARNLFSESSKLLLIFVVGILPVLALLAVLMLAGNKSD